MPEYLPLISPLGQWEHGKFSQAQSKLQLYEVGPSLALF